jgi:hypothetical protein
MEENAFTANVKKRIKAQTKASKQIVLLRIGI